MYSFTVLTSAHVNSVYQALIVEQPGNEATVVMLLHNDTI